MANAQFKEADSRLTEAYHVLLNAKVCSDREFVRPLTQFPDAINILPTDMVNSWRDKFVQFSVDHKKQEVGPISSGLGKMRLSAASLLLARLRINSLYN